MKEKIPFYHIANMFFVGSVFSFVTAVLFFDKLIAIDISTPIFSFLKDWNIVVSTILLILVYEIGFIINRLSSITIAPLFAKTKIWPKSKYDIDLTEICERYPKVQSMVSDFVLMRSHVLLYLIFAILSLFSRYKLLWIVFMCLSIIFIFAGKKHNDKINKIRESYEDLKKEEQQLRKEEQQLRDLLTYTGKQ